MQKSFTSTKVETVVQGSFLWHYTNMKKSIVGLLMVVLLVPAFSFASTTTPATTISEQTRLDQRQELMLQLISLLRTYIAQLQQQLALKGITGAPLVLGVSTSTATSTEQAEAPKKRRSGGGGGGSSSSRAATEAKETACRLAADLRIAPGETKLAYYIDQINQPVYAEWAPDTTKELYNYLVAYTNNYIATGNEFFTHIPDYRLYYALQHVRVLETRFSQYVQNKTACGEEAIDATDVLVPLTPEILALTAIDPETATTTDEYEATLTFGLSADNPDSTTLTVETDQQSDYYTLLSFNVEADGGEVAINKAAVRVDVPDENITDVIGNVRLQISGQYYDAEPYGLLANGVSEIGPDGSYAWYVFDLNNEVELSDDEEVQMNVEVGFDAQEGAYPRFQTVWVQVDEETRSLWESEGYDDLSPVLDYFGLALGETHQVVPPGLIISDYQSDVNTFDENNQVGEFNFALEVTSVKDDLFVSSQIAESGSIGVIYSIEGPEGYMATTSAVVTSTADEDVPDVFTIQEGNTENITITITLDPSVTGNYRVTLDDVFYAGNNQGTPSVGSLSEQEQLRSDYLVILAD